MTAWLRFASGEDRLSALLRELPRFEPPMSMAQDFAQAAARAQVERQSIATVFEPPVGMETAFLAEAARIQAAQQPRHDAVLDDVRAGKPIEEVLGQRVSEATAQWLADRPQRVAVKVPPAKARNRWLPRLGVVFASVLFGAVATQLWLVQREPVSVSVAMAPEAPAASAPESQRFSLPDRPIVGMRGHQMADARVPASETADRAKRSFDAERDEPQTDTEMPQEEKRERLRETNTARNFVHEGARDADKAGSPAPAAPAEQASVLAPRADEVPAGNVAGSATGRTAEAAKAAAPPPLAKARIAAASGLEPALAAAPSMRREAFAAQRVALTAAPSEIAAQWQGYRTGRITRIFASQPDAPEVRDWVERFRLALPPEQRPAAIVIEQDATLPAVVLRIE